MTDAIRKVGFVGLGRMGAPMAQRLLGAHSVRGYDPAVDAGTLAGYERFERLDAVTDVAADADAVILMLPGSDVVEHVVFQEGLLDAMAPGSLLIDMSSSEPLRTRALAERAAAVEVRMLDAPVSGGVGGARDGTLTIMVGGPAGVLAAALPLLECMGARIRHVGESGAGHALKALNNLMSAVHLLASSEALTVAKRFGLDLDVALEVVNSASGRSGSTEAKWPKFIIPETFDSGFAMNLMIKDMNIALGLAHDLGTPIALGESATEMWRAAADDLPADADHTEIARWLQQIDPVRERAVAG
jgi:3-hydroxyisobutyrate dehydrogenase